LCVPSAHSSVWVHAVAVARKPDAQVHAPLTRCGLGAGQLAHIFGAAPVHETHDESQARQEEPEA
jgi:hypothetical protein